jgi:para-nitrobenzyl esterase
MRSRRHFLLQASQAVIADQMTRFPSLAAESDPLVGIAAGKIRGLESDGIKIFRGVPYGENTAGSNRFMPPIKVSPWKGTRDALLYGPSAPQLSANGAVVGTEDCLVLNICTPSLESSKKRPVMVWLHGGGFSTGSGQGPAGSGPGNDYSDGINLSRSRDVVFVSVNHRLNVFGYTDLSGAGGEEFSLSGGVGMLDLILALEWVRDNITQFGGDPGCVTIFGHSGGGRKIVTLMAMPAAQGLYHRAIIQSGSILHLTTQAEGRRVAELLLEELRLKPFQLKEFQNVPLAALLKANAEVYRKLGPGEPGSVPNTPVIDGKSIPGHPWDPAGPAISAKIPLLTGWVRTEETLYDRPTAESLALDETGLTRRARARLGQDPAAVIDVYRKAHPDATPWDLWIFIATDHPRGIFARELAKRKADQRSAPAFVYRFDWETPALGGHYRSPHGVEGPFMFNSVSHPGFILSSDIPETRALAAKVSAAWVAFARSGNPNTPGLPKWPAYSRAQRATMILNVESRVVNDPDRATRLIMEKVLKLS